MPGLLTIRRLRAEYRIDRESADPARIRNDCDYAQRARVAPALAGLLARWFDRADGSVWLVRRLDIDLAVNTADKSDELARALALAIARALAAVLIGEGDGVDAIRFADRAAYLARFFADAATGDAWSRWYYATFDGLRMLPTSAALSTAATEDPRLGLAAMQRLSDIELRRVLGALATADRELVLDRFAASAASTDVAQCIAAAWLAWRRSAAAYAEDGARALALFVRTASVEAGGQPLRAVIEALLAARRFVESHNAPALRAAITGLRAGDRSRIDAVADRDAPALLRLACAPAELLEAIFARDTSPPATRARAVGSRSEAPAAPRNEDVGFSAATLFGGVFFLLPRLAELPLEDWVASWPAPEGAASASALRLLVMAKCMSGARAQMAFADPVLRRLFRIAPELSFPSVGRWLRGLGPARRQSLRAALRAAAGSDGIGAHIQADDRSYLALPRGCGIGAAWDEALSAAAHLVLRRFARRLPGFADSRCAYLYRNFLDTSATVEEEPDRIVARVGRPPLHLVLNLTGITRTTYTIPGEARPVAVFTQD